MHNEGIIKIDHKGDKEKDEIKQIHIPLSKQCVHICLSQEQENHQILYHPSSQTTLQSPALYTLYIHRRWKKGY